VRRGHIFPRSVHHDPCGPPTIVGGSWMEVGPDIPLFLFSSEHMESIESLNEQNISPNSPLIKQLSCSRVSSQGPFSRKEGVKGEIPLPETSPSMRVVEPPTLLTGRCFADNISDNTCDAHIQECCERVKSCKAA